MASATSTTLSISSSPSSLVAAKSPRQFRAGSSLSLPAVPQLPSQFSQSLLFKTATYFSGRKAVGIVAATAATEEAPVAATTTTEEAPVEVAEIVKTVQNAWDKVEDKYAVSSLAVAGVVGLWASAGMVSAIDKLPLVPGVLELVGIGYSGWFAYRNLLFKPKRDALVKNIKDTYEDVLGISSSST